MTRFDQLVRKARATGPEDVVGFLINAVTKRTYGTGCLFLRGRIWWAAWYENGLRKCLTTQLTDKADAEQFLLQCRNESQRRTIDPPKGWCDALRLEVYSHYCGGTPRCQCPGCKTVFMGFLQLDHVNGDGAKHKANNGGRFSGKGMWRWLKDNGYPAGFQVLCCNCNGIGGKRCGKHCPMEGQPH